MKNGLKSDRPKQPTSRGSTVYKSLSASQATLYSEILLLAKTGKCLLSDPAWQWQQVLERESRISTPMENLVGTLSKVREAEQHRLLIHGLSS